jgi:phosphate transport system substrate-binding protein
VTKIEGSNKFAGAEMTRTTVLLFALFLVSPLQSHADVTPPLSKGLIIDGMGPMKEMSAAALIPFAKEKKIGLSVEGHGGASGVKCAVEKKCHIGFSPTVPKDVESNLVVKKIGFAAISLLVSKDLNVNNLTSDQVRAIFLGKVKNWKDVGGPDLSISLWDRKRGRGTREVFEKYFGLTTDTNADREIGSFQELANRIKYEKNTKGLVTYDQPTTANIEPNLVKTISLDGVEPTDENLLSGKYKFGVQYFALMHKDNAGDPILKEALERILAARKEYFPKIGVVFTEK